MIYDIKEIKIDGKIFLIVRIKVNNPITDKKFKKKVPLLPQYLYTMYPYVNSYVYIKGIEKFEDKVLGYPTHKETNIMGVDTAHAYNFTQTIEQRAEDSLRQIKDCIKCYLKELEK